MTMYISRRLLIRGNAKRVAVLAALLAVFVFIFSGVSYAAAAKVTTERIAYPTFQTQKAFNVKGLVSANKTISKAKLGAMDADGKWVMSSTRTIKDTSFKLSLFNNDMAFKKLGPGMYHYRCLLTFKDGSKAVAFHNPFVVYKLTTNDISCPDEVTAGTDIDLTGIVTLEPVIDTITIGATDSKGKWVKGHYGTVEVNSDTYNLASASASILKFKTLSEGTYGIKAVAEIAGYELSILDTKVAVKWYPNVESKNLNLPTELKPGKGFGVKGSLTANASITSVQLGIIDSKDKWVYKATAKPASTKYDLSKLDSKMLFSKLETGNYRYRCILKIKCQAVTVFDQPFKIMSVTTSGVTYPKIVIAGNSFTLSGVVKSNPKMSSLYVGVKKDGSWVKNHYVKKTSSLSSFDIADADSKISFKDLPNGIYTYTCVAKVLGESRTLFEYEFEVTDKVAIKLDNVIYPPDELGAGKAFSIGGKITSNVEMSKVRVGIVDTDNKWKVYKDFTPKSTSWDIAKADSYITFGTLTTGTYRYKVVVYIGDKSYTKVDHEYKVVQNSNIVPKATVHKRIEQLLETLDSKYFTTDGKKATSNVDSRCNVDNVLAKNSTVRNLIKKNKGAYQPASLSLLPQHYGLDYGTVLTRGYSCCGFANFAEWYIFADDYTSDVSTVTIEKKIACNYTNADKLLKPGDVIRIVGSWSSGHSAIVLNVLPSGIELLDANSSYYDPSGDVKASRICTYKLGYSKVDYMSVSRATNSPYL